MYAKAFHFKWGSCYLIFCFMCLFTVLLIFVCPFVLFLLVIVLSVLLRYTDSDYPVDILKLFIFLGNTIKLTNLLFYLYYIIYI